MARPVTRFRVWDAERARDQDRGLPYGVAIALADLLELQRGTVYVVLDDYPASSGRVAAH